MKGTVYSLLGNISQQSGYLFIYDSKVVDNDVTVKVRKGERTIRQAIYEITGDTSLEFKVIGTHILITSSSPIKQQQVKPSSIHALEICYMTGKTYTSFRTQQKKERPFRILKIGLTRDREELYDRINRRVDQMMEEGLLDEVRSVLSYRHLNSLNTVGYKELFKYLDGEWELPFAIEKIKQNSRIYSRKQMTWFKRDEEIRWFHPEQETEILEYLRLQNLTHLPSLDTF